MKLTYCAGALLALALVAGEFGPTAQAAEIPFTDTFFLEGCRLSSRGVNDYFIPLKSNCYLLLEGEDDGETVTLLIFVLPDIKVVDGVRCAVVRESEWVDGELVEVSWNYFSICRDTESIFYHGEDVDIFEDDMVTHDGAWLAGQNGARPGLIMPGHPLNGSRYYQEIALGVALDKAEHTSNTATVVTDAGTFEDCLTVVETTDLEPGHESFKAYARGVGLIQDGVLKLTDYGCDATLRDFEPEE